MSLGFHMNKVCFVGTVGIPAIYGGFETLVENLVVHNLRLGSPYRYIVYCSAKVYSNRLSSYLGADLRYIPLRPNGYQSILYDIWSILDATIKGADSIVLLGHGGSFVIPILKIFTKAKFITNIDGIEWRRAKWSFLPRMLLRLSEACAIRYSDVIISDNQAIYNYVLQEFGVASEIISYGGDHAYNVEPDPVAVSTLPSEYAFALCRIEPENNVSMILEAFSGSKASLPLVFVGNWDGNKYSRMLKNKYKNCPNITLHDPVYESRALRALRDRAVVYVHGHSAGGTNPSLVEMMHFGIPIFAFDCLFNRYSTDNKACYFTNINDLELLLSDSSFNEYKNHGVIMRNIATERYSWNIISTAYQNIFKKISD